MSRCPPPDDQRADVGQVFGLVPHEAQLERLQIDHVVDGGEIEEGRDDRGESDVQIGRSGKLRDDEGRRAEDRG
ncbi:hypothetical protein, partial [Bilophila wadsworthia]|uniref:hypothetical protein n=1 Tax=Bilophila wadsworthia TaxID=35833 RepID=UPI003522C13A